jgi:hypothetical protein
MPDKDHEEIGFRIQEKEGLYSSGAQICSGVVFVHQVSTEIKASTLLPVDPTTQDNCPFT